MRCRRSSLALFSPARCYPGKLSGSPLDIIKASRGYTPPVHFYQHGDDAAADFFDVGRLKKAMAKALVAFYPFAGRLTTDANGRPSIDCNNEGVQSSSL
uniref:Uncharacterized protein n=1 Tax=Oryza meridionalis TaxID=40149 RepID=A0A0E0EJ32_9ORYZ